MKRIFSAGKTFLYEPASGGPARVLVCSTAASRRLLTDPVSTGRGYRLLLRAAVEQAFAALAQTGADNLARLGPGEVCVLTVLRGGLSFGAEDAIAKVFGIDPLVSFAGTDRPADRPVEVTYTRWELGAAKVLVIGDILGTGGTMIRVLGEAIALAGQRSHPIRSILLVTIGSAPGIARLQAFLAGLPADRPAVTIVALEARYGLPVAGEAVRFSRFPFDLLRTPAGSAPEYEMERLLALGSLFERCAVYDGGVRAFTPPEHAEQRGAWWAEVIHRGVPLTELAEHTAGLAVYRHSRAQWQRELPWSGVDGVDLAGIHHLGREALRYAEQTPVAGYVSTTLMEKEFRDELYDR